MLAALLEKDYGSYVSLLEKGEVMLLLRKGIMEFVLLSRRGSMVVMSLLRRRMARGSKLQIFFRLSDCAEHVGARGSS